MRCPIQSRDNAEILLAYVDRKLEPDSMAAMDRHIEECCACQQALDGQRAVWSALDAWEAAEISRDFDRRLWQRIDWEQGQSWWKKMFQPVLPFALRPAMPIAAACVMLVATALFRTPGVDPLLPQRTEVLDIEQVERTLEDIEMLRELGLAAPAGSSSRTM